MFRRRRRRGEGRLVDLAIVSLLNLGGGLGLLSHGCNKERGSGIRSVDKRNVVIIILGDPRACARANFY